jgi:hypothetical protein
MPALAGLRAGAAVAQRPVRMARSADVDGALTNESPAIAAGLFSHDEMDMTKRCIAALGAVLAFGATAAYSAEKEPRPTHRHRHDRSFAAALPICWTLSWYQIE